MAKNPNHSLHNRHHLYIGDTGSGKSQALKQNKELPDRGVQTIIFDPGEDHKAHRYSEPEKFKQALIGGIRSGKGFRLALTVPVSIGGPKAHEWFCRVVAEVLDGRYKTYVIDEELSRSCRSAAKADPWHAFLLNEGRKYGLIYHGTIQYPQEVPKTIYRAARVLWVGCQDVVAVDYVAKRLGIENQSIADLNPLEFYVQDRDKKPSLRREKLIYKN